MKPRALTSTCGWFLSLLVALFVLAELGGGGNTLAATRCVSPGGTGGCYSTIQAAIDAAVSGVDNVTVAAGTYHERVVLNKNVDVTGAGAASTFINADDLGRPLTISGAAVSSGTVVSGLTLTNGTRSDTGGGLLIDSGAAPTIESCTISDNVVTAPNGNHLSGGGIRIENASATIRNDLIQNNRVIHTPVAGTSGNLRGAGVSLEHANGTRIENSRILGNVLDGRSSAAEGWSFPNGGGVEVMTSTDVTIQGNRIESNALDGNAGGGGGISVRGASAATIWGNTIIGNSSTNWSSGGGGIDVNGSTATILRNRITDNAVLFGGEQIWAYWRVTITAGWNLISQTSSTSGSAVVVDGYTDTAALDFYHNTIVKHADGLVLGNVTGGTVADNLIANNTANGIHATGTVAAPLRYNDVWGNGTNYSGISPGTGDMSADPLFANPALGDYRLLPRSPAIDASDPGMAYLVSCSDLDGRHCYQDGNFDGIARADVGAYESSLPRVFAAADFDGDGLSDKIVYRTNTWYVKKSDGSGNLTQAWGTAGDIPVPGDYGGSSLTDYAVWRPSTGTWYVKKSDGSGNLTQVWGTAGDIPVPANFLGDAKTDFVVWRPSTGTWYVKKSGGAGVDTLTLAFGRAGDIPIAADFDNDGIAELAVFRPGDGRWYIRTDAGGTDSVTWGAAGDIPLPSQMADDGRADKVLWRPSNGTWYVLNAEGVAKPLVSWGLIQDIPAAR